ncbi:MAG: hypothetical protein R3B57_05385 [Phycisphaerales bacterium]
MKTGSTGGSEIPLAKVAPWSESETLRQEKETLGFYVSSHPLEQWAAWTSAFPVTPLGQAGQLPQDKRVIVAALVQSCRQIVVRNGRSAGQKMAILTLEDMTGVAEAVMFSDCFNRFGHLLEDDAPKFVLGRVDHARGEGQLVVDRMAPIDGLPLERNRLRLVLRDQRLNGSGRAAVERIAELASGEAPEGVERAPIDVVIETKDAWIAVETPGERRVAVTPATVRALVDALGLGSVQLTGGVSVELNKRDDRRRRA